MAVLLEVQNISKHFGGLKAINEVSMKVKQGEILGIIGPNGAGKTTFFNLITGTYRLTSGKILFDGKDVTNKSPEKMAHFGMARTFQNIKGIKVELLMNRHCSLHPFLVVLGSFQQGMGTDGISGSTHRQGILVVSDSRMMVAVNISVLGFARANGQIDRWNLLGK